MRIGLAQINSHLGNFKKNREKIIAFSTRARDRRCDLVVFPEMALFGYHPGDLLERKSIVREQLKEFSKLCKDMPVGISALVGMVQPNRRKRGKAFYNVAALIRKGAKPKFFKKQLLPTYDVFDDHRHFEIGDMAKNFFVFKGKRFFVTICEDMWAWSDNYPTNPILKLKSHQGKVDFVLNMSGSPYALEKKRKRNEMAAKTAKFFKRPLIYVNLVGAQDELIFDGGSFVVDRRGKKIAQSTCFQEDLLVIDFEKQEGEKRLVPLGEEEELRQALVLGIRDFAAKTGLQNVHLGLSGGIDSALVACLAVDALGPQNVTALALPSPFNAPESLELAKDLADNLGCRFLQFEISQVYTAMVTALDQVWGKVPFGLMHENMQARLRGVVLMAFANKENSLLLTTGNKSEMASGYATLYGDMCGGLAPLGDLVKSRVYALSRHYNRQFELIPQRIIDRPPSAELRPNQKDQDSLPEYDELDRAVSRIVEKLEPARGSVEKWLLAAMMKTEFKRWQAPPILKVTEHAFGRGRRLPIAHRAFF